MPVSSWLLDHLHLQPGQTVLELAAGPGDTGFMAAELIRPGGHLISSDGSEAMVAVARERARALAIDNVEFKRLELEWIDQDTASVDAIVCRWGLMLTVDPAAALHEMRRVLRPGGSLAIAVWDQAAKNPWSTLPSEAMIRLGHMPPPDPDAPGMYSLAAPGRLGEMLAQAGFLDVVIESIAVDRSYRDVAELLAETGDLSRTFGVAYARLSDSQRAEVRRETETLAAAYTKPGGTLTLPGRSLVASAGA